MSITKIHAREILDSRGNPTVEVDLWTAKGQSFGHLSVTRGTEVNLNNNKNDFTMCLSMCPQACLEQQYPVAPLLVSMRHWSFAMETRVATLAKVRASQHVQIPTFSWCLCSLTHLFVIAGTKKAVEHVNKDIAPKLIEKVPGN